MQGAKRNSQFGALDRIAIVALFLQATELHRPLSLLIALPPQQVNLLYIAFFVLYLAQNARRLGRRSDREERGLLDTAVGQWWMCVFGAAMFLLLVQVLVSRLSLSSALNWMGLWLLFASMFITAAVLFRRIGERGANRFFILLIAVSWVGFAINIVNYAFIREVLIFTGNDIGASLEFTRILGFYQHPNMAALVLVMSLAFLVTSPRYMRSSLWAHASVLAATVGGVVITGSRTSLLLIAVVILWYIITIVRTSERSGGSAARAVLAPAMLILMAVVSIGAVTAILGRGSELYTTMVERIQTVPALLSGEQTGDASLVIRQRNLDDYVLLFEARPGLGYGPDFAATAIEAGQLAQVSQNAWLEWAVGYGFALPVVIAIGFVATLNAGRRVRSADPWLWDRTALIVGLFVAASFSVVSLLMLRAPVIELGALLGGLVAARERHALAGARDVDARATGRA